MTVEARTVAFYNFRQILKFLVYYLPQLSFITGSSISDLFDRASHKIAVRRVWRPHIRRSMVNEIILDYWVVLTVCAGAESCWNTYGLPAATSVTQGLTTERFGTHFGSVSALIQRCVEA